MGLPWLDGSLPIRRSSDVQLAMIEPCRITASTPIGGGCPTCHHLVVVHSHPDRVCSVCVALEVDGVRLDELEQAVADCAELIRHMGQTLSWSAAGQGLNDPPEYVRGAQRRLKAWHAATEDRRKAKRGTDGESGAPLPRIRDAEASARPEAPVALPSSNVADQI
jgi:hypothetical protein